MMSLFLTLLQYVVWSYAFENYCRTTKKTKMHLLQKRLVRIRLRKQISQRNHFLQLYSNFQ